MGTDWIGSDRSISVVFHISDADLMEKKTIYHIFVIQSFPLQFETDPKDEGKNARSAQVRSEYSEWSDSGLPLNLLGG